MVAPGDPSRAQTEHSASTDGRGQGEPLAAWPVAPEGAYLGEGEPAADADLPLFPSPRRRRSGAAGEERQPAPPPAPTISVTIGRVEVRATQAGPQPKPQRPGVGAASLDDYLRERGGRR